MFNKKKKISEVFRKYFDFACPRRNHPVFEANQKKHFLFDDCVIDFDFIKMSATDIAHFNGCVLIFSVFQ